MELRFTSGQVCKMFNITKQALLFYDRMGVLKPKYVDENNGYRYYALEQLDLLYLILSLKETGIPLKEISVHLESRTAEKTIAILESQIAEIKNKIVNLQAIDKNLHKNLVHIKQIENSKEGDEYSLKYLPEQYLIVMPVQNFNGLPNYTLTISKITEYIVNNLSVFSWDLGCISTLDSSADFNSDEMFAAIDTKVEDQYFKLKPAGWYVCTYHYGSYCELDDTYEKLREYIESKGFTITGKGYENYIVSILATKDDSRYITEVTVAIEDYELNLKNSEKMMKEKLKG
ncbi:MerR family transcriptional regulator [Clostridium estertheticum]|uniref:MerR family transcriptional regulator n=1 Tax=Clostridium estertheticum TaxID=238834 RepID=UPI0013E94ED1|nr:MerR family transcriptional regulator [Clostridium estertheticum]MBZ9685943.1 MerR family transcriptional regulator [Clostridium estertheticum]